MFTITRENHKGLMEWLTESGWKSEDSILEKGFKKRYFDRVSGTKEVLKQRENCRISSLSKSIKLNF